MIWHSSKCWWLWKQPVVGWHWKERVVICGNSQQGYMLPVFFAIDQLHRSPRCAEIQSMSQQDASLTCPYRGLLLDTLASCPRCGNHAVKIRTVGWPRVRTDELSHGAEAQLCHEHDVLAHCLSGRQTTFYTITLLVCPLVTTRTNVVLDYYQHLCHIRHMAILQPSATASDLLHLS